MTPPEINIEEDDLGEFEGDAPVYVGVKITDRSPFVAKMVVKYYGAAIKTITLLPSPSKDLYIGVIDDTFYGEYTIDIAALDSYGNERFIENAISFTVIS